MKFILLTHERELLKATNTGRLVKEVLGQDAEIIVWKRKEPSIRLLNLIKTKQAALLFPENMLNNPDPHRASSHLVSADRYPYCVIIDSTWQEARKIFNQSEYLKQADITSINMPDSSIYSLRRNQIVGGFSTAECVIEILKQREQFEKMHALQETFNLFNKR